MRTAVTLSKRLLYVHYPQKRVIPWRFHGSGAVTFHYPDEGLKAWRGQPLHSSALFTPKLFPDGDRGGNLIKTAQRGNLHSLWDGFLGGEAKMREAHQDALNLLADPEMARIGDHVSAMLDKKTGSTKAGNSPTTWPTGHCVQNFSRWRMPEASCHPSRSRRIT
jgi:hypothetical protein